MSHDIPSFHAITQQLEGDGVFSAAIAKILTENRLVGASEMTESEMQYSIEPFIAELHEGFARLYANYSSPAEFMANARDAYEEMCMTAMARHSLQKGDMVATLGDSVILILDPVTGESVIYQSTDPVVGALQGPIALDVPDELNLATLGNAGGTAFRTGLFVANPCLVADDGTVYEPEEFSLGPTILITGTAGSRFKKLPK